MRINRYIVGCKYNKIKKVKQEKERINRYIVGCKYGEKERQTMKVIRN